MASNKTILTNILELFLSISFLIALPHSTMASSLKIVTHSSNISYITAIFGFGDSTIDTGNNNYLPTTSEANHLPYARDFPFDMPKGRFTNREIPLDLIAAKLGLKLKLVPPYLKPNITALELLTGTTFGSGSSGLDNLTAEAQNVSTIPDQIKNFDQAFTRIRVLVGQVKAKFIVKNAMFFFSVGTNDFTNFYDIGQRANEFNISGYQFFILQKYEEAIRSLYDRGARKFVVTGLSPVGCLPIQITVQNISNPRRCVEQQNIDSMAYNVKLQASVTRMESQLQDAKIVLFNTYDLSLDMINNPAKYGYVETLKGCCGTGLFEFGPTCLPDTPTCPDASKYNFFDAVHPSYASYKRIADLFFSENIISYLNS